MKDRGLTDAEATWTGADEPPLLEIHNATSQTVEYRVVPAARDFDAVLSEYLEWSLRQFPTSTPASVAAHLQREVRELRHNPESAEELADIVALAFHSAARQGFDLTAALAEKLNVLRHRKWREPDAEGVVEHVREEAAAPPGAPRFGDRLREVARKLRPREDAQGDAERQFLVMLGEVADAIDRDAEERGIEAADAYLGEFRDLRRRVEALVEELRYSVGRYPLPDIDVIDAEYFLARLPGIFGARQEAPERSAVVEVSLRREDMGELFLAHIRAIAARALAGDRAAYKASLKAVVDAVDNARLSLRREDMGEHFTKLHVEGLPVPVVLHRFTAAEPDADPHDHPWGFTSFVIAGGYTEQVFGLDGTVRWVDRLPGDAFCVEAEHIHRIVRLLDGECWTLVMPGAPERVPGFYRWTPDGTALHRPWNRSDFQPLKPPDTPKGQPPAPAAQAPRVEA